MQRIAESELIINDRGAVYHLNLRPEELAPTVITVGDPSRVQEVSKYFDRIECKNNHREFVSHTGYIGTKRITVVSTGIGPDNIDIVLNELDALVNVDFENRQIKQNLQSLQLFRLGTSGSLQMDLDVDSLVCSTHGLGIDNLLHFYRHTNHEEERQILHAFQTHTQLQTPFSSPYITGGGSRLLKHFATEYHQGITVTCPGFYAPQGRVIRMGLALPELVNLLTAFRFGPYRITNFEMETAAIYGLGKLMGHQCLSLNVIIANRIQKTFSKNPAAAIEKLIRHSLERISVL
jgi:uridine phosphorylase